MHPTSLFRSALVSSLLVVAACGREDLDSAEDADESVSVTSAESALTTELSDEVAQPTSSADQVATAASARIPARFTPSGCATSSQAGATVTYTLTNCTGPYGLVKVSGTLTAVYARAGAGVQVTITGSGLKANDVTFDVNSTVTVTTTGGLKSASVVTNANGTGPRGGSVKRNGMYSVTYDSATECATVTGVWETTAGARTASTAVTGYARCKGACPTAGTIVHTTARGAAVTVSYDGSTKASWSTSGGRSGTVNLYCAVK